MTEGLWAAVIGVGGTILGTVLGFFLGKIDLGRLKIQVKKVKSTPCYDYNQLYDYSEYWVISLYNGANKNRVFREAKIILKDSKNKVVFTAPLKDLSTTKVASYGTFTDDVGTVNIQPKSGCDIDVKFSFKDFETIFKASKVFLQYNNEKFDAKTIKLWACDYKESLKLQKDKEQNNG